MKASRLAYDLGFTEGPIFSIKGDMVVTSLDQGAVFRVGKAGTSRRFFVGGAVNGAVEDRYGVLYLAQAGSGMFGSVEPHLTGGIQILENDRPVEWLTQEPVSPNDLCFGPDGMLYVTDPTRRPERDDGRIWRMNPATGSAEVIAMVPWYPNGIAFGLDDMMYVASTGDGRVLRYRVADGVLSEPEEYLRVTSGGPDGMAFDLVGNLIVCCIGLQDGSRGHLEVWSPDNELLEVIEPGSNRLYTNVAIDNIGSMAITDAQVLGGVILYRFWRSPGLPLYPFRSPEIP